MDNTNTNNNKNNMIKSIKNMLLMVALFFGAATISQAAFVYSNSENNTTSAYNFSGGVYDQYLNVTWVPWVSWTFECTYDDLIGGYAVMTITDVYNNVYYVGVNADGDGNLYQWSEHGIYYDGFIDLNDPFLAWYFAIQTSNL